MRSYWRLGLFALLGVPHLFGSACVIGSLASYQALGATGCTINGEIVANFNFSVGATSLAMANQLTNTAIIVTPTFTASKYQLRFSATGNTSATGFTVGPGDFANYKIDFNWDPVVVGAEDDMVANTPVPPGTATITTQICAGVVFSPSCPGPLLHTLTVFNDGIPADAINTAIVTFPAALVIGVQNMIDLESHGTGSSTITGFNNAVFTPEPVTYGLCWLAIGAMWWRSRQRRI